MADKTLTLEDVERLEELSEDAAPIPWQWDSYRTIQYERPRGPRDIVTGCGAPERDPNLRLIEALRNAAPALISIARAHLEVREGDASAVVVYLVDAARRADLNGMDGSGYSRAADLLTAQAEMVKRLKQTPTDAELLDGYQAVCEANKKLREELDDLARRWESRSELYTNDADAGQDMADHARRAALGKGG